MVSPNDQGLVIESRLRLRGQTVLAIVAFVIQLLLLAVLMLMVSAFGVSTRDYDGMPYMLAGLVAATALLGTAVAVRGEIDPPARGDVNAGQTLAIATLVFYSVSCLVALLVLVFDVPSAALFVWEIVWTVALFIGLFAAVRLYLAIRAYRRNYDRAVLDECRKSVSFRDEYLPRYMGSSSA